MVNHALTGTQRRVLGYIKDYAKRTGRPPTFAEMTKHFGWRSGNAPRSHLMALQRKGHIRIVPNIARGIELL